jgi:hypothetical protein
MAHDHHQDRDEAEQIESNRSRFGHGIFPCSDGAANNTDFLLAQEEILTEESGIRPMGLENSAENRIGLQTVCELC